MNDGIKKVGKQVRLCREQKGVGLREMATLIGKSPSWYSKFERGLERPSEEMVWKIGKAINWSDETIELALLDMGQIPQYVLTMLQQQPELLQLIRRAYTQVECMKVSRFPVSVASPRA